MTDLTKRLRKIARDKAFKHHHVNMYAPGDKTTHKDFIEWEAADRIEQLEKHFEHLEAWCEQTNPDAYDKWKALQE